MGERRGKIAVMAALSVIAVAVGVVMARPPPDTPVVTTSPTGGSVVVDGETGSATVPVHVSGMVVAPGVVRVSADAIVAEAIEAAGGLRPGARSDQINLAAPIVPGGQIVVPGPGAEEPETGGTDSGPISLNQASASDLETLPGVGPVLAERIVAFRESNGPFAAVEDLLEVSGIGEAKLAALRDLVRP